jgi:hypothetical protein
LELQALEVRIEAVEGVIVREHRTNAVSRRLASIPGIGPITASAIAATIPDPSVFKSGRELAAWIGLVPRQHPSGGKQKLGRVSKQATLFETLARHWRDLGYPPIARQNRRAFDMGRGVAGSPSVPAGLAGAGQQDGADRIRASGHARRVT